MKTSVMARSCSWLLLIVSCGARMMANNDMYEDEFQHRVKSLVELTRQFLYSSKFPTYSTMDTVQHTFEDKYQLTEYLTGAALTSAYSTLEVLESIREAVTPLLQSESQNATSVLRFEGKRRCEFDRWEMKEVRSPSVVVESSLFGSSSSSVVTKVNQTYWRVTYEYQLSLRVGSDSSVVVLNQSNVDYFMTTTGQSPLPSFTSYGPFDLDLTWLLEHLRHESVTSHTSAAFKIDRLHVECKTPRRNKDVSDAFVFFSRLQQWVHLVHTHFQNILVSTNTEDVHQLFHTHIHTNGVFVSVVPMLRAIVPSASCNDTDSSVPESCSVVPRFSDLSVLLAEESKSLATKLNSLSDAYKQTETGLFQLRDARLLVTLLHLRDVAEHYTKSVNYVEQVLRQQFVSAIGKEIRPSDLDAYMKYHNHRIFLPEYRPQPFVYSVRRDSEHSPEGVVSIEGESGRGAAETGRSPIMTVTHQHDNVNHSMDMTFAIDAATKISFGGSRFLHLFMNYEFDSTEKSRYSLVSSARQFSSYILVLGRIVSQTEFEPMHALIIKDKDELKIPLSFDTIPTAQEFYDATYSLSDEQKAFANAYRGMQLSNTLFGLCVIQIKPQLEKALNLVANSLVKEIQLTQDLMELFMEYQIPVDLLSFGGNESTGSDERLASVKVNVAAMKDMIRTTKESEIMDKQERIVSPKYEGYGTAYRRGGSVYVTSGSGGSDSTGDLVLSAQISGNVILSSGVKHETAENIVSKTTSAPNPKSHKPFSADLFEDASATNAGTTTNRPPTQSSASTPSSSTGSGLDFSRLPYLLDKNFDKYGNGSVLRAAILNPSFPWTRQRQTHILSTPATGTLSSDVALTEKKKTFELLDAITRSGGLHIDDASLHIILATTHHFDKNLMDTVIQDNTNPIEKIEQAMVIGASTIHGVTGVSLLTPADAGRILRAL